VALEAQTAAMTAELLQARAGYDADEHAHLDAGQRQAQADLASLRERLRLNAGLRAARQQECDQLLALETELATQQTRYHDDEELLKFIQFSRSVMNEAGPLVTRALIGDISKQASEIFAEIMHDHTQHLHWDEEYEITVEKAGHSRSFRQLSGGEQMAAAIAVRLALLRKVSSIDIAFFDEPTANLDETRRATLADQIVSVRGFSQIFVISHDDTFERVTDHTVRVFKENGISRVETL
jgi:exonuclease SbcC